MRTLAILFTFFLNSLCFAQQQAVAYTYDRAGNRISRSVITLYSSQRSAMAQNPDEQEKINNPLLTCEVTIYSNPTVGEVVLSVSKGEEEAVSYDFSNNNFGYLGKKGNSVLENIGYGLGMIANTEDFLAGGHPGEVTLRTENDPNYSPKGDLIGHSQLEQNGNILIDWGPYGEDAGFFNSTAGTNSYSASKYGSQEGLIPNLRGSKYWDPITIKGVNVNRIRSYANVLNQGGTISVVVK